MFESYKGDADGCDSKHYVRRVVQLARSLEARPDLARRLRSLSFAILSTPEVLGLEDRKYVEETVVRVGDVRPPLRPGWNDDSVYHYDSKELQYPLLPLEVALIRAPAIEYLQLPIGDNWSLYLVPDLAILDKYRKTGNIPKYVVVPSPPADPSATCLFPHLHTVTLTPVLAEDLPYRHMYTEIPWYISQLAPNMRSIYLPSDPGDLRAEYWIRDDVSSLPHLRRIHFQHTCIGDYDEIYRFLQYVPHLEVFALQWAPLWIQHEGREQIGQEDDPLHRLWDMVGSIEGPIRELRLDFDEVTGQFTPRMYWWGRGLMEDGKPDMGWEGMESLRDFDRLEHVSINGHALRGLRAIWDVRRRHWTWIQGEDGEWSPRVMFLADMFPPTIRRVTFWRLEAYENEMAMVEFAHDVAKGRYPNLERVLMAPRQVEERLAAVESAKFDDAMSVWEPVMEELRRDFSQGGVEFQVKREVIRWQYDDIW